MNSKINSFLVLLLIFVFILAIFPNLMLTPNYENKSKTSNLSDTLNLSRETNNKQSAKAKVSSSESIQTISNDTESQILSGNNTRLAVDANGKVWAVTQSYSATFNHYYLNISYSTSVGVWVNYRAIYDNISLRNPDIAIDSHSGEVYIIYEIANRSSPTTFDIHLYQILKNSFTDISSTSFDERDPSIAIEQGWGADNYILVAYKQITNSTHEEIHVKISTNNGASFTDYTTVGSSSNYIYSKPDIAQDRRFGVYLTYSYGTTVDTLYTLICNFGWNYNKAFTNTTTVYTTSGNHKIVEPSIAVTQYHWEPTTIVIAFELYENASNTDILSVNSHNGVDWVEQNISTTNNIEANPNVAVDGATYIQGELNNFYISYTYTTPSTKLFQLQFARYTNLTHWNMFYQYDQGNYVDNSTVISVITMHTTPRNIMFGYTKITCYTCINFVGEANILTINPQSYRFIITEPSATSPWKKNNDASVVWQTIGYANYVNIMLFNQTAYKGYVAWGIPNTGSYSFVLTNSDYLENDGQYYIYIQNSNDTFMEGYSETFHVIPFEAIQILSFISPESGITWIDGDFQTINWACSDIFAQPYKLDLYKGGKFYSTIINDTGTNRYYPWHIPDNIPSGNDYQIKVTLLTNTSDSLLSGKFEITSLNVLIVTTTSNQSTSLSFGINPIIFLAIFTTLVIFKKFKNKKGDL